VEIISSDDLAEAFQERIDAGFLYGDFQFMTDASSADFLRRGVFSCYCPAPNDSPAPAKQQELSAHDWKELLYLAHTDRRRAFELYSAHYLSTNNQIYWSDTHQSSTYLDGYHSELDVRLKATARASEMITEVYVPRKSLTAFLDKARAGFRRHKVELIYGTIRLIEKDAESFLAWAKESYACIVLICTSRTQATGSKSAARLSPSHRSGNRIRRQLLPHLSPLGNAQASRNLLSAISKIPSPQTTARSGGTFSKRLVSPLQTDVRGNALTGKEHAELIRND
jgi:hypothetical protein